MKEKYLLIYNILLAIGWTIFVIYELLNGFRINSTSLLLLNICQGAAVLEIVHALLRWVSSPPLTTFIQVFSRVFVLVFINLLTHNELISIFGITGVDFIIIAWGFTEVIRYSFYSSSLLNKQFRWLTFFRYTLFIILYPLGMIGEWMILLSIMKVNNWAITPLNILIGLILVSYVPLFPKLYIYMWKQRAKKLESN